MSNPEFTAPDYTSQTAAQYKANIDASIAANGADSINIAFSYSGGTFTVHDAKGSALSSSNPGFVRFQDPDSPGQYKYISVEANQTFIDDAGSSEIVNNLFGTTASTATAAAMDFYLYAVPNDAMSSVAFMISRDSGLSVSPAAANIGAPDDAVADAFSDMFSLESLDETLYDGNPCIALGAFAMSKSASDDWTVQTISPASRHGMRSIDPRECWPYFTFTKTTADNNATGDGAEATVTFDNEIKNFGEHYDGTNTFTAPIAGTYQFQANNDTSNATGITTGIYRIKASNRTFGMRLGQEEDSSNRHGAHLSCMVDMDAGDTCKVTLGISGVGADTADIAADGSTVKYGFSGRMIARD